MLDSIHPVGLRGNLVKERKRRFRFRLWFAVLMFVLLIGGIFIGSRLVILAEKILDGENNQFSFRELFLAGDKQLVGEEQGQIRILLMGIGGKRHQGGTLTDTIILATVKLLRNEDGKVQIGLVSIPRDLTVFIPGQDFRKINTAYAYGELGGEGLGAPLAVQAVERLIGEEIPYYAAIDFDGFKKIIDDLGGIEMTVEQGFTDAQFPDEKFGYLPPITFEAGKQKMDGQRALQYVRSRHGNNNQGSDFARTRRQQQILQAVGDKVMSIKVLTNLNLLRRLLEEFADNFRTNLEVYEIKRLYSLVKNIKDENIVATTIGEEEGLVCSQIIPESGAYILIPCGGLTHYEDIRLAIHNQFVIGSLRAEQATIEIQNATDINLLGKAVARSLTLPSLEIVTSQFQGGINYPESVIYDNWNGKKKETLKYLREKLNIRVAASPFPFPTASLNPDFVIVVAADLQETIK